jgi:hypothetical protein
MMFMVIMMGEYMIMTIGKKTQVSWLVGFMDGGVFNINYVQRRFITLHWHLDWLCWFRLQAVLLK